MDVGVEFSHYRVIEHIGRGGMADVWSARDKRLSRTVAIKTVARDLSQDMDPLKLFEREAKTIANLEHPHILPIYEFGEYDGQLYIVMRYVSGGSLEDILERGPLGLDECLRVAKAVGQALDYAHNSKVIHLDLKPSNVLLDSYQSPYLADFGLATMVGPEGRAQNPGSGTLLYMAPEQLTSDHLDFKADVYSFSILMFHMITGQLPFDASMPLALMQLQMRQDLPEVHSLRPDAPQALTTVLRRATAIEPNKRPDTLKDVIQQIEQVISTGRMPTALDTASRPAVRPDALTTGPIGDLLTGPIEGLLSRPIPTQPLDPQVGGKTIQFFDPGADILTRTTAAERMADPNRELISKPIEGLESRPPSDIPAGDLLLSRKLPDMPSEPPKADQMTQIEIDLSGLGIAKLTPEQMARREIEDIYSRARRAWARGQGRFLLGVTDYILIADAYARAEADGLALDEQGIEMLLRGALEYDHEVDYWWGKLTDEERRRWVALHALRSENAPARVRALDRLAVVKDADPPQIPRQIAQALQVEVVPAAQMAALTALERRAPVPEGRGWETEALFSPDIDGLLATHALTADTPVVAELAARVIGRIRSTEAVRVIAEQQTAGDPKARRALALVRDEAPSLPASVSPSARLYAWWTNTVRRLGERPGAAVQRFILAFIGGAIPAAAYVWVNLADGVGTSVLLQEIFERMTGLGLLFGLIFGLTVLLASELPDRLRGFWAFWARAAAAAVSAFATMTLAWGLYDFLLLRNPAPDWGVIGYAGIGAGAAFALLSLFRLPGIVRAAFVFAGIYLPLFLVWHGYWVDFLPAVSIVYFREYEGVFNLLIPMVIVMAVGATARDLWRDARRLWARRKA